MESAKVEYIKNTIIESLKKGCTRSASFIAAGITHTSFSRWIKDDEIFHRQVLEAEKSSIKIVENALYKKCQGYEYQKSKEIKYHKDGKIASEKIVTEIIAPDTAAIIFFLRLFGEEQTLRYLHPRYIEQALTGP